MTTRRLFLQSLAVAGAGLATRTSAAGDTGRGDWANQFAAAREQHPWLLGYQGIQEKSLSSRATLSGEWPADLTGTLFRNGPAQHEVAGFRYQHWFDGDGMLQAFRMQPDGVTHNAKLVATHKLLAEEKAGRALYPAFGSTPPQPAPVTSPDAVNVANISVLHHHNKLLALWEAGSPWEMNTKTLDTRGPYEFTADLPPNSLSGVPFSAHPRVEPDGTLWNFGYVSNAKLLVLWHINPAGRVVKMGRIPMDPITMVHDFIVTQNHIVVLVPPLHFEPAGDGLSFLDNHHWRPADATRVLVVEKDNFNNHFFLELPAQWVFHFGNGWEDKHGIIRFDGARAPDPSLMLTSFRDIMRGQISPARHAEHHQYRIDTKQRRVAEMPLFAQGLSAEFPSIDPRVSCRRNQRLLFMCRDMTAARQPAHTGLNAVATFDYASGQRHTYVYPDSQIPEEHLFVPHPASAPETRGWILGTALDWQQGRTLLNVFDGARVEEGPLATATLPYVVPLGLHGKFVGA